MTNIDTTPAGWYPHPSIPDTLGYWDGAQWVGHMTRPATPSSRREARSTGPLTHSALEVKREVNYVRQQKGHSAIMQFLVLGIFTLWIVPIYYLVSPNHYYHI